MRPLHWKAQAPVKREYWGAGKAPSFSGLSLDRPRREGRAIRPSTSRRLESAYWREPTLGEPAAAEAATDAGETTIETARGRRLGVLDESASARPITLKSAALGIGRHVSGIANPFNGHINEFRIAHVGSDFNLWLRNNGVGSPCCLPPSS
jgi:hypothetical protein